MAKEVALWDDSALTIAFDQAMSNYKRMHIKGYEESSAGSTKAKAKETIGEATSLGIDTDTVAQMLKAAEVNQDSVEVSNVTPIQDQNQTHSTSQDQEEYNLLCKQYYDVEQKRGLIWEKLKRYATCGYSYPYERPETSSSQNQYNSSQACYPATTITCCPNIYPFSATSCSVPTCCLGYSGTCTGTASSLSMSNGKMGEDDDVIKKGMLSAQKALSNLKENVSGCQFQKEPSSNGETDITDVLNAWYSAGLYTGKYLTEKSLAKP